MYKINNVEFESPVDLMDAICDEYRWQWEDFFYDIEIPAELSFFISLDQTNKY